MIAEAERASWAAARARTLAEEFGAMTRKDYVAMAAHVRNLTDGNSAAGVVLGITMTAKAMADVFALDNPAFNRERFLKACGVQL